MRARSRRLAAVAAAALVAVPTLLLGTGASAATNGNWWFSAVGAGQAQSAGWTGNGVKVAVIDLQITPSLPVFRGAHLTVDSTPLCSDAGASVTTTDTSVFHGSDVTAMINGNGGGPGAVKGVAPDAQVTFYGYGTDEQTGCTSATSADPYAAALTAAVGSGAKIVTTSVGTDADAPDVAKAVARALAQGVILLASPPDRSGDSQIYPAAYNGVVSVNAVDESGRLQGQNGKPGTAPDVQADTTVVAPGVDIADAVAAGFQSAGSSLATPEVAGMLADVWQKYPKASANQLLQSLVRNTTPGAGTDGYGHGVASLTKMLAADPTQYPDTNPLMGKSSGEPSAAQVKAAGAPTASAKTAPTPSSPAQASSAGENSSQDVIVGAIVIAVVLLLVLGGIAALIVFLVRRSRLRRG